MHGWRARIGHINPSPATVGAEEWRLAAPAGVTFVGSRYRMEQNDRESHDRMLEELERAALELTTARVDVIVQCSTLAALGREAEIRDRIEAATAVTALTVLGSMVAALRELDARRIALGSPYTSEQNEALAEHLEEQGFEVVGWQGLDELDSAELGTAEPHTFYRLGRELASVAADADTLLLSCGNTRTFEILEPLQWDTGLEVTSSNQAALWNALRTTGVGEPVKGFGRLLERPRLAGREREPRT